MKLAKKKLADKKDEREKLILKYGAKTSDEEVAQLKRQLGEQEGVIQDIKSAKSH